jgi:hypothetical protein
MFNELFSESNLRGALPPNDYYVNAASANTVIRSVNLSRLFTNDAQAASNPSRTNSQHDFRLADSPTRTRDLTFRSNSRPVSNISRQWYRASLVKSR